MDYLHNCSFFNYFLFSIYICLKITMIIIIIFSFNNIFIPSTVFSFSFSCFFVFVISLYYCNFLVIFTYIFFTLKIYIYKKLLFLLLFIKINHVDIIIYKEIIIMTRFVLIKNKMT